MKLIFFPLMVAFLLLNCNKEAKSNFKKENVAKIDTVSLNNRVPVSSDTEIIKNKENNIEYFGGDSIFVSIKKRDLNSISFELLFNKKNVKGTADLVMLEDNGKYYIPEGTPILDENTQKEYVCDSTYSYDSQKLSLTFAMENKTKKRLSFIVNNSKIKNVNDGFYTLYKK